ncbi:MAG: uridylate kinase [Isosphaeraceae bacterium]
MIPRPVSIVKVGGSLLDWPELPGRLAAFLDERRQTDPAVLDVLLCGGGPFAETVRRLDGLHRLGDYAAHRLAIQAMDLASTVLLCLLPGAAGVDRLRALGPGWPSDEIPLLVPSVVLDELEASHPNPLPASWDVTSDSIAAWIAGTVRARSLVLLKSADLPPRPTREAAARLGRVDPFFPLISAAVASVEYLNLRDPSASTVSLT